MVHESSEPPFGAYALPRPVEWLRRCADRLPDGGASRRMISVVRRICYLARRDPVDVDVFDAMPVRLYPRSNFCERRVFLGVNTWDNEERKLLSRMLANRTGEPRRPFAFIDGGANVGLYTLFVLSESRRAGRPVQILAIEPDPMNLSRLRFNLAASAASPAEVMVAPVALGDRRRKGVLLPGQENRGEVRLADKGEELEAEDAGIPTDVAPLHELTAHYGVDHIDVLKLDIEGAEPETLEVFFSEAPRELWPSVILLEVLSEKNATALCLCQAAGYGVGGRTRKNAALVRTGIAETVMG